MPFPLVLGRRLRPRRLDTTVWQVESRLELPQDLPDAHLEPAVVQKLVRVGLVICIHLRVLSGQSWGL